jgi:hypothetical protein
LHSACRITELSSTTKTVCGKTRLLPLDFSEYAA